MKSLFLILILIPITLITLLPYLGNSFSYNNYDISETDVTSKKQYQSELTNPTLYQNSIFYTSPHAGAEIVAELYNLRGEKVWSYTSISHKAGISEIICDKRLTTNLFLMKIEIDDTSQIIPTNNKLKPVFCRILKTSPTLFQCEKFLQKDVNSSKRVVEQIRKPSTSFEVQKRMYQNHSIQVNNIQKRGVALSRFL